MQFKTKVLFTFRMVVLGGLLAGLAGNMAAGITTIDPSMSTGEINAILNGARGGDTLFFQKGTYRGPFVLENTHGEINRPVVIMGSGTQASVIDGETAPGMNLQQYGFHLLGCSWITIENFELRNCWTDLIRAEETSYLSVKRCRMFGGKRALFATGRRSHHFLVEHCTWEQEERVWSHAGDFSWDEIHHGIHQHYNGSLFQGSGISGVFVLRDNHVKNTFNAFRLSQINDGELDLLACTNGEIYRNTIQNTSDNVLEPEVHAKNLHFYHNRMVNGHAFISITEVAGGEIYVYGNTAVSLPDSEDGWTIFKISSRTTALSLPLYIFNNSWEVDFDIIGSPRNLWQNNHLRHFNNAIVATASDSFGIYDLGADNRFDFDCSNLPWPGLLTDRGMEKNGLVADPGFVDPYGGDFRLKGDSPCIDRGTPGEGMIRWFEGTAPDVGAYDNGMLIEGPPFRYTAPDAEVPYRELPRITRYRVEGSLLNIWFSVPMDAREMEQTRFMIRTGSSVTPLKFSGISEEGYCVHLAGQDMVLEAEPVLMLSRWPYGENGMIMTGWASEMPVTLIKTGGQQGILGTTRLIADKIIRETSFDFNLVPMSFNGGVSGFTLEGIQSTPGETWFAMARIESEDEGDGILGLSYSGAITVHLNGRKIYSGTSDSLVIHEYTYDRYWFQQRIGVRWQKGVNELLVRCEHGDRGTSLLMLPLNDLDAKPVSLNFLPVPGTAPESSWMLNGPWIDTEGTSRGKGQPSSFPPESGYQSSYRKGNRYVPWRVPAIPMVRELVIPGTNSYTRDAYADWHYANGGTMLGILSLHQVTGDEKYLGFVEQFARQILEEREYFSWQYKSLHALRGSYYRMFRKTMLDDTGGPVLPFAELQRMDPDDASWMPLLREMLDYVVSVQERLPDGTLSRPEPEAATVWADDLFMSVPFLLRMAEITGDATLYDEVARQVIQFNHYLMDPATGLYFHGWYNGRNKPTPVRWGRANGWIIWATSEALLYMPPSHPAYEQILSIFRAHMQALAATQDPSGLWHQVLDDPETFEETSCTAMFTLGMARGVRSGWLEEGYREHALRGWTALQEKIGLDGTVKDICRGTGIGESVEFYQQRSRFDHDPRGLGAMLTAGCEIHLLLDQ